MRMRTQLTRASHHYQVWLTVLADQTSAMMSTADVELRIMRSPAGDDPRIPDCATLADGAPRSPTSHTDEGLRFPTATKTRTVDCSIFAAADSRAFFVPLEANDPRVTTSRVDEDPRVPNAYANATTRAYQRCRFWLAPSLRTTITAP